MPTLSPMTANGVRIGALLALLALLPLGGAAWFAGAEYRTASAKRDEVDTINLAAQRLIGLTELRARVLDEYNWSTAIRGLEVLGVSPAAAARLSSVDLEAERAAAISDVDELLTRLELTALTAQLADVRGPVSADDLLGEMRLGYEQIEQTVVGLAQQEFDTLTAIAASVADGEELLTSLRVLDAATEARQALTAQLIGYFTTQFSGVVEVDGSTEALIVQRSSFLDATDVMTRLTPPGSNAIEQQRVISERGDTAEFGAAVDRLIALRLTQPEPENAGFADLMSQLDEIAHLFLVGSAGTDDHVALVEAAERDVTSAGSALEVNAVADQARVQRIIVALIVSSAVLGTIVTRAIARPLRDLATATRELQDGGLASDWNPRGPVEVRHAGQAIKEAAAHLRLAERQATALADGDLEHPSLAQSAPGTLGASLQSAVRTLTSSLNDREQYRLQLAHEATHDTLTQLPNRKASLARLRHGMARSSRTGSCLAVLFLDLDGFKDVNDNHGHQAGDTVLQTTAQRLLDAVRDGDHVGRLGGDEFLIIAEPVGGMDDVVSLGERILRSISVPIETNNAVVAVNASIGIAIPNESGLTADEILRDADIAVYRAKDNGKGRIELCDDRLREQMMHRTDLEVALRHAIATDELELDYQPIIDAETQELVSVEALVRWPRPGDGRLPPADFLPVAEQSELITDIDRWVIRRVARQLAAWADHERLGSVPVAVNVSARHLAADTFVPFVLSTLRTEGVDPARVVVEVTESAILDDLRDAAAKLEQLRANGVRVAIDDFGTGYTSLAHLKTLPIDILKIDRSFTNDPTSQSLVKLIIDTGHLLGARITAEGVESQSMAEDLTGMGSDDLQGFLYGRPVAPEALEWLGVDRPWSVDPSDDPRAVVRRA